MKFTHSWLTEHLDTSASMTQILETLTAIGLEVESFEDRAAIYAPFKVVEVLEAVPHPNADRLRVCQVKTESGIIQVVCGAPNARTGMKAVYAPEGSVIPVNGMVLKKTKIRDVESNGMMVSEREMALGEDSDGIIDVALDVAIGTPLAALYGLDDPVIEINLTPNRPDCASVRGIARDLAAAGLGTLKPLSLPSFAPAFATPQTVTLEFPSGQEQACPAFAGRLIRGVKNGPSPLWMQHRLKAIGLRPISALVDITNYFCIGLGRPLHVFDADKLTGGINVRPAKKGESFAALNDKSYELDDGMSAVCDDSGVLGLGGIMGGSSTGCSEGTVNVFLECAHFDPLRTARTGRALSIVSDARYRFERGVDPQSVLSGIDLAAQMIVDLCGGSVGEIVLAGSVPDPKITFDYRPARFEKLMGYAAPADEQKRIFAALGFVVTAQGDVWNIAVPSWRPDIMGEADLVEEIARIKGFDAIPSASVVKEGAVTMAGETPRLARLRKARAALAAAGLQECITWSFMDEALAQQFGANDGQQAARLKLANPISAELNQMRPSILPNLVEAAGRNSDRGFAGAALFEIGPIFRGVDTNEQPVVAAGIRAQSMGERHWSGQDAARAVDAFDAKADALKAIAACGGPSANLQVTRDAPRWYHPGRSGVLRLGTNVIATFGEIHPALLDEMKVTGPVAGFEVFIENIPEAKRKGTALPLADLSAFQPVSRDFAFLAPRSVDADLFVRTIKLVDRQLITDVDVFDVYTGKGIESDQKSVAISVMIQPKDRTLTDSEIEGICQKIVTAVQQKTGASLRG